MGKSDVVCTCVETLLGKAVYIWWNRTRLIEYLLIEIQLKFIPLDLLGVIIIIFWWWLRQLHSRSIGHKWWLKLILLIEKRLLSILTLFIIVLLDLILNLVAKVTNDLVFYFSEKLSCFVWVSTLYYVFHAYFRLFHLMLFVF